MSEFRFGHPDQHEVGSIFESRKALSDSGIHGPPMHGIWGRQREGACSIVMSGGYEDDIDELDYILYTGHGGQDVPGGKQIKGLAGFEGKKLNLSRKHKINSEFLEYHKHLYENAKHL